MAEGSASTSEKVVALSATSEGSRSNNYEALREVR